MRKLLIKRFLILCWGMFAFFILISALKSQLLLNEKTKETLVKIFPEGWGFFTKNPKDPEYKIYIVAKN